MTRSIFITDLDGTFLDHDTYQPGLSVFAARKLVDRGIELAFCSSKTIEEQKLIRDAIKIPIIMIVENGSAIYGLDSQGRHVLGW